MYADTNRLLELFGDEARQQLGSSLTVQLKARDVLEQPGAPTLYAYFPTTAVISLISMVEDGASTEVGIIGHEGMVGIAGILGTFEGVTTAVVQVAGDAIRVPLSILKTLRLANPSVRQTLDLYIEARFIQAAQATVCSRLHPLQSRLSRWLLGVHDRVAQNEIVIPQESIAALLGAQRPTVSIALQRLQDEGAISRRGRAIVITERPRLEALACECHRLLEHEFERLLSARAKSAEALAATAAPAHEAAPSASTAALEGMREIAGRLLLASIREQEAREEAEAAVRTKNQFLATVSHELRNPLNAILGWCTVLQAQGGVQAARGLEVIARNARAQLHLVDDLLDAARVTSARFVVDLRTVALPGVVQDADDTVTPSADERQVSVRVTMGDEIPPVPADANRLRQALVNVLTNSLKFTDTGGSIDVRVSAANGHVHVSVQDTGRGIEPAALLHVFEQFRGGAADYEGRRGLGLGLTIARTIVELHGGRIEIDSRGVNQGTTCTIYLPVAGPTE